MSHNIYIIVPSIQTVVKYFSHCHTPLTHAQCDVPDEKVNKIKGCFEVKEREISMYKINMELNVF